MMLAVTVIWSASTRLIGGSERDQLFSRLRGSTKKKGTNKRGEGEQGKAEFPGRRRLTQATFEGWVFSCQ